MEEQNYKKVGYSAEDITRLLGYIPAINGNFGTLMNFVNSQPNDGNIYGRQGNAWVNLAAKLGSNIFIATGETSNTHHLSVVIAEEYINKNGREPKSGDLVVTPTGYLYTITSGVHQVVEIGNKNAYSVHYQAVALKPQKGTDYFTESEKTAFATEIKESILNSFVDVSKNAQ